MPVGRQGRHGAGAVGLPAAGPDPGEADPTRHLGQEHVGDAVAVAPDQVAGGDGRPAAVTGGRGAVGGQVHLGGGVGRQVPHVHVGTEVLVGAGLRHVALAADREGDVVAVGADPGVVAVAHRRHRRLAGVTVHRRLDHRAVGPADVHVGEVRDGADRVVGVAGGHGVLVGQEGHRPVVGHRRLPAGLEARSPGGLVGGDGHGADHVDTAALHVEAEHVGPTAPALRGGGHLTGRVEGRP